MSVIIEAFDSLARGSFTGIHTKEGYSAPDAMMAICMCYVKVSSLHTRDVPMQI